MLNARVSDVQNNVYLKTKSSFHDTICKLTEIEKEIEALDTKARNEE
jgi:hypothetical protein